MKILKTLDKVIYQPIASYKRYTYYIKQLIKLIKKGGDKIK
jgi:hypothetical protein